MHAPPTRQLDVLATEIPLAHQLLMKTLKTLKRVTKKLALHFALNPTATMMHAPNPTIETRTRANDQFPWKMKPMNRKMRRIRPASWKLVVSHATRFDRNRHERCCVDLRMKLQWLRSNSLLSAIGLAQTWDTSKQRLLVLQRVREHHEEPTDHTQVSEEEGPVEQQSIAETCNQLSHCILRLPDPAYLERPPRRADRRQRNRGTVS